jgi:IclR family acetate operon transcriptional repressor
VAKTKPYPGTQAVLRAVSLLKVFNDERPEWGLTELSQEVHLNKTTTYRLLTALASEGMVARNSDNDTYRLGPAVIMLGGRALRSQDLRSLCRPELRALATACGETASLEILTDAEMLILDEVMGDYVISGGQAIGTRWPAHATSTGKSVLAHLARQKVTEILPVPLPEVTSQTITSLALLAVDLDRTRERGYALAVEELELGLVGVGAPLLNYDGDVVGAISLSGPTLRFTPDRFDKMGQLVRDAGRRISAQLGFEST